MLGSKKIKLYFQATYAEQLQAASQYSLVSIERSFFLLCCSVQARRKRKNFCDYLSFGIFFLSFSSKFRAKIFLYIVQRRCRNSKSKRRGFLFNFCFPVFVFTVFCFFLSHHQLERSLILVLWSLTKKFVKPPSLLFIIVKVGGPRSICFSQKWGCCQSFCHDKSNNF